MSLATIPTTESTESQDAIATATRTASQPSGQSLLRTGATASLGAAVVAELFTLAARAADVPMRAADPGAAAAKSIPVGGVFMAVLMNAAIGLLLAAAVARWTKSPARTFAVAAGTYAVLSLLGPVFATHTHLATKVVLSIDHVLAAVIIIPRVTAVLRQHATN